MLSPKREEKSLINRYEKDVKGALTTLLILGILIKEKKVWSYQIKKKLMEITNSADKISNSSLYSLLGRLENNYGLISSKKDEEVQRRFFFPTEACFSEFKKLKDYWFKIMSDSEFAIKNLDLLDSNNEVDP
jgi:DNA-binding PadR family transcriptional regulator